MDRSVDEAKYKRGGPPRAEQEAGASSRISVDTVAFIWYAEADHSVRPRHIANHLFLGVMASLLQEIISVYPLLNPSQLTAAASNRVCNALALLQCVASHPETRGLFLSG